MRFLVLPVTTLALLAHTAHADEVGVTTPAPAPLPRAAVPKVPTGETTTLPISIGVNLPLMWQGSTSIAGSLSIGVTERNALRLNVASYKHTASLVGDLLDVAAGGDGDEAFRSGRTTDIGIGLVHYSRKLWDGATVELGALRRARNISTDDEFASPAVTATDSTIYAGRALFGWSWLIGGHAFIAFGVGVSYGYESGSRTTTDERGEMMKTTRVGGADAQAEGYLRFGGAL